MTANPRPAPISDVCAPGDDEPLSLILYVASRAIAARCRPRLAELGITFTQYLVLRVLWERGSATVTELGEVLGLDSGTLSPLLKRLEFAGLVVRRRGQKDGRRVEVTVTPSGDALRTPAQALEVTLRDVTGASDFPYAEVLSVLRRMLVAMGH
ncbi:MarR family winged helix-turn-helix transcriptional regulator [Streptomyces griseoaurantiacus]|uniref:MarR family winged helix-turn-helix transcriptional regulator n=1 Tax=Streptomyces griseoaurantiacus TaxID=68213 RepID=UPI0036B15C2F